MSSEPWLRQTGVVRPTAAAVNLPTDSPTTAGPISLTTIAMTTSNIINRRLFPIAVSLVLLFVVQHVASAQYAQPAPVQYAQPYPAATPEVATVDAATQVINEIMAAPARAIPRALLHDAQAIVIAPGLIKGGFIIGARYGHGVLVMRNEQGVWRAPSFITIAGGSIGWQLGVQSTDVILVFKTRHGVQDLINGKFTIGGDVSAAAGPVGREASASTDIQLRAEIYSYSRSRGLFAGAALDGTVVSMDNAATAAYYRGTGILWADAPPGHPAALPPSAGTLLATIAAYADGPQPAAVAAAPAAGAVPAVVAPVPGQPVGAPATVPVPAGAPVAATVPAGAPPGAAHRCWFSADWCDSARCRRTAGHRHEHPSLGHGRHSRPPDQRFAAHERPRRSALAKLFSAAAGDHEPDSHGQAGGHRSCGEALQSRRQPIPNTKSSPNAPNFKKPSAC